MLDCKQLDELECVEIVVEMAPASWRQEQQSLEKLPKAKHRDPQRNIKMVQIMCRLGQTLQDHAVEVAEGGRVDVTKNATKNKADVKQQ